ncbi:MAG TPA: DNA cytosine methyltransferase [Terriglobia bacterium]|nr:DNA cytosine methyltransferase [Terriglobia bacterium]
MKRFTCINLFCGCGGFSLGMERAGFTVLASFDSNQEAITVFRKTLPEVALSFVD